MVDVKQHITIGMFCFYCARPESKSAILFVNSKLFEEGLLTTDGVHNLLPILLFCYKVGTVDVNLQNGVFVLAYPLVVASIEQSEVLGTNGTLEGQTTLPNVLNQRWHRSLEIDHQIGWSNKRGHGLEELHIGVVVRTDKNAHMVEVLHKDVGVLVNCAVLHNQFIGLDGPLHSLESFGKEIDLKIESPIVHVGIKILQIGVVFITRINEFAIELLHQQLRHGTFAATYISCYAYIHETRDVMSIYLK